MSCMRTFLHTCTCHLPLPHICAPPVYRGGTEEVYQLSRDHFVLARSRATALAVAISGRARRLRV